MCQAFLPLSLRCCPSVPRKFEASRGMHMSLLEVEGSVLHEGDLASEGFCAAGFQVTVLQRILRVIES